MNATPKKGAGSQIPDLPETHEDPADSQDGTTAKNAEVLQESGETAVASEDTVKIKRTYNFAGKVHTEEKVVARDSAEARLYLLSLDENADPSAKDQAPRKILRKAFRSVFEPIIDQSPQRADLQLGLAARLDARAASKGEAKKLNTVEKSRMDWAGYVDKEGIKDELKLAGKSKDSYAERQQFLARSEAKRDDEARRLRLAGKT
jgi:hypothetical protein